MEYESGVLPLRQHALLGKLVVTCLLNQYHHKAHVYISWPVPVIRNKIISLFGSTSLVSSTLRIVLAKRFVFRF
jgi:hypothetical protein